MAGPIGQAQGVQPQQNFLERIGSGIVSGLKAIGSKIAEFGHNVAAFFRGLGGAAQGAQGNAHPAGATAPVLTGQTFSAQEKQTHMDQALQSPLYQALGGSAHGYINQTSFEAVARSVLNSPMSVAGMKAYGVTLDEAVAISMYTSQAFGAINDALRNNTGDPAMTGLAQAFTSGLAKLPSFDGNTVNTPNGVFHEAYRGAKLPQNVGSQYLIGAQVADPGIMSSTYDKGEAFGQSNYSITLLLKPGSQGKDITMFSDKPTECEVAFPPNVQFQVVARVFDSGGMMPPHLEATYHPGFMGAQPMGVVELVLQEI